MLALPLGLLNSARFVRFMHDEADLLVMALIGHVILVSGHPTSVNGAAERRTVERGVWVPVHSSKMSSFCKMLRLTVGRP